VVWQTAKVTKKFGIAESCKRQAIGSFAQNSDLQHPWKKFSNLGLI
jgi:hypothetical protein